MPKLTTLVQPKKSAVVATKKSGSKASGSSARKPSGSSSARKDPKSEDSKKSKPPVVVDDDDDDFVETSATKEKKPGNPNFWKFKQRQAAPPALGLKEIPEGPEDCLAGCDFVITGVLDSIEREDAERLIKRHGGGVKSGVSKKTTYLLTGQDPGESKLKKAKELKTKIINEDGLLDLIRRAGERKKGDSSSARTSSGAIKGKQSEIIVLDDNDDDSNVLPPAKKLKPNSTEPRPKKTPTASPKKIETFIKQSPTTSKTTASPEAPSVKPTLPLRPKPPVPSTSQPKAVVSPLPGSQSSSSSFSQQSQSTSTAGPSVLWVEKYQPKTVKAIVGQHGAASPANKLLPWLENWYESRKKHGYKATSAGMFGQPGGGNGSTFKAALLSGPPGIGKTTTAMLVCKEAGFVYVHVNASDNRSKRMLDDKFMAGVTSHSLLEYKTVGKNDGGPDVKSALIMDEVDGMAGNEDRGGIAEVIQLIKNSKLPVICICNDRSSQKMRSLVGYCYDLRFPRPRVELIRAAMLSVCAKEGVKIQPNALDEIIEGSNRDIRQTLHNLYTWTISKKTMSFDEASANAARSAKDSIKVGPFDVCRTIFAPPKGKEPIGEKIDLYFEDYNFVPLFIHENYLHVNSYGVKNVYEQLDRVSRAADSFSMSDMIDREIRGRQNWSLLPMHAVFTAVIPGLVMQGAMGAKIDFPAWLGKNSTTNKNKRIIQDLRTHMHLRISANHTGLNLDYLPVMRRALTVPLVKVKNESNSAVVDHAVEEVANVVNAYDLLNEDREALMEVTTWESMKDPLQDVPAPVKAKLTRLLNKGTHLNPYSASEIKKGRAKATDGSAELLDEETAAAMAAPEEEELEGEDESVEKDAMIKMKKPKVAAKPSSSATTSRGGASKASTSTRGGRSGGRGAAKAGSASKGSSRAKK